MEKRTWFIYPADVFKPFDCFMSWELVTIVAESNSWKTTFAMDIISKNAERGIKWYYINLEFPIRTMWESRWLWINWKTKRNLTDLEPLTEQEQLKLDAYVDRQLNKFDYFNNPEWIDLKDLIDLISQKAVEWYQLFVVDTFSRIHWNLDSQIAHTSQNRCMEQLQELAQRLWIAIVMLHHTNKQWTFEWSQKIKDLSNVFIIMSRWENGDWESYTEFELTKDKFITKTTVTAWYRNWEYFSY